MSSDEPDLVRFSEVITETEDPVQASKFADLFLLCTASAVTVLGSLIGCGVYLHFARVHYPTFHWMAALLGSVAFGGACGCAVAMRVLHARQLIGWELRAGERDK